MPGPSRAFFVSAGSRRSVQRELGRLAAEIRRGVAQLAVDRAIIVLTREVRVPERRRKRIILEFAVARQHFGAGVEPGAGGDVNPGVRTLLIDHVGAARAVIGAAVLIILLRALGLWLLRAGRRHAGGS